MHLLSTRFSDKFTRAVSRLMTHKCTVVNFVYAGTDNEEGRRNYTEVAQAGVPCIFLWDAERRDTDAGPVTEQVATLYMMPNVVVSENDRIDNVLDRKGATVLLNATVNTINTTAEGGHGAMKVLTLEGAVI